MFFGGWEGVVEGSDTHSHQSKSMEETLIGELGSTYQREVEWVREGGG